MLCRGLLFFEGLQLMPPVIGQTAKMADLLEGLGQSVLTGCKLLSQADPAVGWLLGQGDEPGVPTPEARIERRPGLRQPGCRAEMSHEMLLLL